MTEIKIYIQARMESSRLPGKVLNKIGTKTVLDYVVERASEALSPDSIVVLTTTNSADDVLAEHCDRLGVKFFRGHPTNLLKRFYDAWKQHDADFIFRVCADSPLLMPHVLQEYIGIQQLNGYAYDYISNTRDQTYPIGLNVELFRTSLLQHLYLNETTDYGMEHVTPYFYKNPDQFNNKYIHLPDDHSSVRVTLDECDDYVALKVIDVVSGGLDKLRNVFDLIDLYRKYPWLHSINKGVLQTVEQ